MQNQILISQLTEKNVNRGDKNDFRINVNLKYISGMKLVIFLWGGYR